MPVSSRWNDAQAEAMVAKYSHLPQNARDLALRCYSSNLIGSDQSLVLHGGGNTSVKLRYTTVTGKEIDVLAVKGSGWDLSNIEPQGFPLVDLAHLNSLRALSQLSDEEMVNQVKGHMMDIKSPSPSIETLLHAYLPHKWVDHSHADAVLAVMDQPNAIEICNSIYGTKVACLPYVMPGFGLAKAAAELYESNPSVEAILLFKHGLFTFGDSAKASYEKHVWMVRQAEEYIARTNIKALTVLPSLCICCGGDSQATSATPDQIYRVVAPLIRGEINKRSGAKWVLHMRSSTDSIEFASSVEAREWSQLGPLTPDHVIRTKGFPMVLQELPLDDPTQARLLIQEKLDQFEAKYNEYFDRYNKVFVEKGCPKTKLDVFPRVVLVQGVGIVTVDRSLKACRISADIYEHTIPMIRAAQSLGSYEPPSGQDLFDIEYWSLEQAKLGKTNPPPLAGSVVYVTGAGSGIGLATCLAMGVCGANVVVSELNPGRLEEAVSLLKQRKIEVLGLEVNVTDHAAVTRSLQATVAHFGGVDMIVSNAGGVPASVLIGDCSVDLLKSQMELNFFAHQYVASAASKIMVTQQSGGCLLFNASKAAMNPGPKIGPYAISKAAVIALMKQYALEYATHGITANAINADRVRTNLFTREVIEARAKARDTTPDEYFKLNLLGQEVTADHVAKGFVDLALSPSTTGGILTVDGGNISASVR